MYHQASATETANSATSVLPDNLPHKAWARTSHLGKLVPVLAAGVEKGVLDGHHQLLLVRLRRITVEHHHEYHHTSGGTQRAEIMTIEGRARVVGGSNGQNSTYGY